MPDVTWWYPPDDTIREEAEIRRRNYERFFRGKFDKVITDPVEQEMAELGIEGDSHNQREEPLRTEIWQTYDTNDGDNNLVFFNPNPGFDDGGQIDA
ncbi:MAG: hypothetical protein GTN80_03755 [Nitrososphaeria archaeon]|nr:hypothetical protein [Nitrososphaeria archaeon]